jgi:nitric oxide reductase subunit B
MVGSWNMLVYGTGIYVMERTSKNEKPARSAVAFAFYFLGLTNLMFNWGHHTYIVPAAPWIKMVAYIISMTELLLLAHLIMQWRKTMTRARLHFHLLPYRLLSYADVWILLNLTLAIIISVPAWNYYTHGTHITVAHAMGATIGINTMILFSSIQYLLQKEYPSYSSRVRRSASMGILISNISLFIFWVSLLGSGIIKISGKLNNLAFYSIMKNSEPYFKAFAYSGIFILFGLLLLIVPAMAVLLSSKRSNSGSLNNEVLSSSYEQTQVNS